MPQEQSILTVEVPSSVHLVRAVLSKLGDASGVDVRSRMTLLLSTGQCYTGYPRKISTWQGCECLLFELDSSTANKQDTRLLYLDLGCLRGVEIADARALESLFNRPWLNDPSVASLSQFQVKKEIGASWPADLKLGLEIDYESFPQDVVPAALLIWTRKLISTLQKLAADPVGSTALGSFQSIRLTYKADNVLAVVSQPPSLIVNLSLQAESFDNKTIESQLNAAL